MIFTPNDKNGVNWTALRIAWAVLGLGLWWFLKPPIFPSPLEVVTAFLGLFSDGSIDDLTVSLVTNLQALLLSSLVGLPLAYLSRVPVAVPVVAFVSKMRFVGSAVLYLPLLLILDDKHWVKVWLLTLGELFFLVTTMTNVVQGIEEYHYDDARTLKMSEWCSIWYVNVRGTVPYAIDAIRDNAAIGWGMLMFVEGIIRFEGGMGVVAINAEKHTNYDHFFAAALLIVVVGIAQDWVITQVKKVSCPYA